jgi:hypothetical protein
MLQTEHLRKQTKRSFIVNLHRNLNQKEHIFALRIAPATAVKLLDNIALSHTWMGHFLNAKTGQYWMQINSMWIAMLKKPLLLTFLSHVRARHGVRRTKAVDNGRKLEHF